MKIPEKAQRLIDRALNDLIPTIDRSPQECNAIHSELNGILYELETSNENINHNSLSSRFEDLKQQYRHGSAQHEFYGGLAASIGVLTGQTGGRYEPRALRLGRDEYLIKVKED